MDRDLKEEILGALVTRTSGEETCASNGPTEMSPVYDYLCSIRMRSQTSTMEAGQSVPRTSTNLLPQPMQCVLNGNKNKVHKAAAN